MGPSGARDASETSSSPATPAPDPDLTEPAPEPVAAFTIAGTEVPPGQRAEVVLPLPRLAAGPEAGLPLIVLHGTRPGPTVFLSAAIHGDELNGVEIIRQVLRAIEAQERGGTVIAAPVVNVFGVSNESRYLPDRRDLNRSFPGSSKGSLASRLAHTFMTEVVSRCTVGIDLHTGSNHRFNTPQIRADLTDPETQRLALAFGARVTISAALRQGSLRAAAATEHGTRTLVFEGGVSLRYDASVIDDGTAGVLRVLAALGIAAPEVEPQTTPSFVPAGTRWLRASRGGFLRLRVAAGDAVEEEAVLAEIYDSLGRLRRRMRAPEPGFVIGLLLNPMVYQGDAVVHLAPHKGGTWLGAG